MMKLEYIGSLIAANEAHCSFYMLPRILFTSTELSCTNDAKLLYALMLDRSQLSRKNGWIDEQGRTFIYYTIETAMSMLHIGRTKTVGLFKELENIGLIVRNREFKAYKIYVKVIDDCREEISSESNVESMLNTVENDFSDSVNNVSTACTGTENIPYSAEIRTPEVQNPNLSHTENKYTELFISSVCRTDENPVTGTDGRTASIKKSFKPDIAKERNVLNDLKAKCSYDENFGEPSIDIEQISLRQFTDTFLRNIVGIICHPSFVTDDAGNFVDADDSGNGYANYLKAEELKKKISEREKRGGLFNWIKICFERWNGLVNAKKERGEPIRRKDRYFPKFLESFIKGDYDLDDINETELALSSEKYAAKSVFDIRKESFRSKGIKPVVRKTDDFEMPQPVYRPTQSYYGDEVFISGDFDEWKSIREDEHFTEERRRNALEILGGYPV